VVVGFTQSIKPMDNVKSAGFLLKFPGYLGLGYGRNFKKKAQLGFRPSKALGKGLYQNSSSP
jgi:hypothetical protein